MPGLLRGVARTAVVAGTATAVSNRVSRRQAQRWGAQEERRSTPSPRRQPPPPPPPRRGTRSPSSRSSPSCKDQGILTEEEFAAQKAKILGM